MSCPHLEERRTVDQSAGEAENDSDALTQQIASDGLVFRSSQCCIFWFIRMAVRPVLCFPAGCTRFYAPCFFAQHQIDHQEWIHNLGTKIS